MRSANHSEGDGRRGRSHFLVSSSCCCCCHNTHTHTHTQVRDQVSQHRIRPTRKTVLHRSFNKETNKGQNIKKKKKEKKRNEQIKTTTCYCSARSKRENKQTNKQKETDNSDRKIFAFAENESVLGQKNETTRKMAPYVEPKKVLPKTFCNFIGRLIHGDQVVPYFLPFLPLVTPSTGEPARLKEEYFYRERDRKKNKPNK